MDEGQSILGGIAEELRSDGDGSDGKYLRPTYVIAADIEKRAIALAAQFLNGRA